MAASSRPGDLSTKVMRYGLEQYQRDVDLEGKGRTLVSESRQTDETVNRHSQTLLK